jgi:hypothetical protein
MFNKAKGGETQTIFFLANKGFNLRKCVVDMDVFKKNYKHLQVRIKLPFHYKIRDVQKITLMQ